MRLPFNIGAVVLYICQVTVVVVAAWGSVAASRIRAPRLLLRHYQTALAVGLVLPLLSSFPAIRSVGPPLLFDSTRSATMTVRDSPAWSAALTLAGIVLMIGCGLRLAWLVVGFIRLRCYRRTARELRDRPHVLVDLERSLGARARWFLSDEIHGAATYGFRSPVVLLPATQAAGSDTVLRMVACHELLHVARRDWLFVVAEEVIRAALWFHPAIWFLLDRIQLHREQVVDERVIAITGHRQDYAQALLDGVAGDWSLQPRPASTWMHARHLRARILWIVNGGSMSKKTFLVSALASALLLGASGYVAIYAFPLGPMGAMTVGQTTGRVYEPGKEGVSLPRLISDVKPSYTPEAMQAMIEGTMLLSAVVQSDGTVGEVHVTRSLDQVYGLDQQGVKAVKQWVFHPGTKDGKAVAVRVTVELSFSLKN